MICVYYTVRNVFEETCFILPVFMICSFDLEGGWRWYHELP